MLNRVNLDYITTNEFSCTNKHYLFEETQAIPQQQIYEVELCFHVEQNIFRTLLEKKKKKKEIFIFIFNMYCHLDSMIKNFVPSLNITIVLLY